MSEPPIAEIFAASNDLLLVDGFQVSLGAGASLTEILDKPESELAFFATLEGRVNHSTERRTLRLMMTAEHGYNLGNEIMTRLEEFMKMMKDRQQ